MAKSRAPSTLPTGHPKYPWFLQGSTVGEDLISVFQRSHLTSIYQRLKPARKKFLSLLKVHWDPDRRYPPITTAQWSEALFEYLEAHCEMYYEVAIATQIKTPVFIKEVLEKIIKEKVECERRTLRDHPRVVGLPKDYQDHFVESLNQEAKFVCRKMQTRLENDLKDLSVGTLPKFHWVDGRDPMPWRIVWKGRTMRFPHRKGLSHIWSLVKQSGQQIHAYDVSGSPPEHIGESIPRMDSQQLKELLGDYEWGSLGYHILDRWLSDKPQLTDEENAALGERIKQLQKECETTPEPQERMEIEEQLLGLQKFRGELPKPNPKREAQAADRVYHNLRTSFNLIKRAQAEDLAGHFIAYITRKKNIFSYMPPDSSFNHWSA